MKLFRSPLVIIIAIATVGIILLALMAPVSARKHTQFKQEIKQLSDQQQFTQVEERLMGYLDGRRLTKPQRYEATFMLAENYKRLGNVETAVNWYMETLKLGDSHTAEIYYAMASITLQRNDKNQSIEYFKKGIETAKTDNNSFNDNAISGYERTVQSLESGSDPSR